MTSFTRLYGWGLTSFNWLKSCVGKREEIEEKVRWKSRFLTNHIYKKMAVFLTLGHTCVNTAIWELIFLHSNCSIGTYVIFFRSHSCEHSHLGAMSILIYTLIERRRSNTWYLNSIVRVTGHDVFSPEKLEKKCWAIFILPLTYIWGINNNNNNAR